MPLIPLFNDGQQVPQAQIGPAPQGQRQRVIMDLNAATANFATPLLPMELADRSGYDRLGQAFGNASDLLGGLALKKAEAVNIRRVGEGQAQMQQQLAEFDAWKQKNPDETTWEGEWAGRLETMRESVFGENLSPAARETLQTSYQQFAAQSKIGLTTEVTKVSFRKAAETQLGLAATAFEKGDPATADAHLNKAADAGYLSREDARRSSAAGHAQVKARALDDYQVSRTEAVRTRNFVAAAALDEQAYKQGFLTEKRFEVLQTHNVEGQWVKDLEDQIAVDPRVGKTLLDGPNLPRADLDYLARRADLRLAELQATEANDITQKVISGALRRGSELEFHWIDNPAMQERIRAQVNSLPPTAEELTGEMLSLRSQMADFDIVGYKANEKEAVSQYLDISTRISRLPEAVKGDLVSTWEKRYKGETPGLKERFLAEGYKIIENLVLEREKTFFNHNSLGHREGVKPGMQQAYADFRLSIGQMMDQLPQVMPENPTAEQAQKSIFQVTGAAAVQQRAAAYRPRVSSGFPPLKDAGQSGRSSLAFPQKPVPQKP